MGKCYCDYCDVFLTNDSVAVRKQHNDGNRHKHNVCEYYRQYVGQQLQQQIDDLVEQFEIDVARGLIRPTYSLPPPPVVKSSTPTKSTQSPNNDPSTSPQPQLPTTTSAPANDSSTPRPTDTTQTSPHTHAPDQSPSISVPSTS